jgi:hypothetical protein
MGFLMTIPTYPTNPAGLIMQKVVENGFERLTPANVDLLGCPRFGGVWFLESLDRDDLLLGVELYG